MTNLAESRSDIEGGLITSEPAEEEVDGWISEIRTFFSKTKTELDEIVRAVDEAISRDPVETVEKPRDVTPPAPTPAEEEVGTDRLELLKRRLTARIEEEDGETSADG